MKVISYFNFIEDFSLSNDGENILDLFKSSWIKLGWEPVILNQAYAKTSEIYEQIDLDNSNSNFYAKLGKGPPLSYHKHCYARLIAYSQYVKENGGVIFADFDVINYGFSTDMIPAKNSYFNLERSVGFLGEDSADKIDSALINFSKSDVSKFRQWTLDINVMHEFTKNLKFIEKINEWFYVGNAFTPRASKSLMIHFDGGLYKRGGIPPTQPRSQVIKNYNLNNE